MARWLNNVNNFLEKLDDQEQVADAARFTQRILLGNRNDDEDEDDYYSDEDDYDDEDEGFEDDDQIVDESPKDNDQVIDDNDEQEIEEKEEEEKDKGLKGSITQEASAETTPEPEEPAPSVHEHPNSVAEDDSSDDAVMVQLPVPLAKEDPKKEIASVVKPQEKAPIQVSAPPPNPKPTPKPPSVPKQQPPGVPKPPPPAPSSGNSQALQKLRQAHKKLQQEHSRLQDEHASLRNQSDEFRQRLDHANSELEALQSEVQAAAITMEQERADAKEEKEELLEEQEEELQALRKQHAEAIASLKRSHEEQVKDLRNKLQAEERKRLDEGGDFNKELDGAIEREEGLKKEFDELKAQKDEVEDKYEELQVQHLTLQQKVESLNETTEAASNHERLAQEKLDEVLTQHKRQLQARQEREAELEKTIAELGSALTMAKQEHKKALVARPDDPSNTALEAQIASLTRDLETSSSECELLKQQCSLVQQQLQEVSTERASEAAAYQARQRENDQAVSSLRDQISRLEASVRTVKSDTSGTGDKSAASLSNELRQTRMEMSSISEQLMKEKTRADASKSEILTLKGRLESAVARAETAESALASTTTAHEANRSYEAQMGGVSFTPSKQGRMSRRIRGGRYSQLPSRTLLSSLGLQVGRGTRTEQVAKSIDAIDTWMVETGNILRHEPLARLGFAFYLALLHVWCFCLVFFHAVQSERGDLGLVARPRIHHNP